MIVKLPRKNKRHPNLAWGKYYAVIGIEADDYRLWKNLVDFLRPPV